MGNTNSNNQHEDADKDLLLALYGKDNFVKIYQALEIGKIKFSFVVKSDPKNSAIDCYMNAEDFASDLIELIRTDELRKLAYQSRKAAQEKNEKYPAKIWESRIGVSNKAAEDNKEQLRKFEIAPGISQEFTIKATQNGKSILVGFAYKELKLLAYRWGFLEADWNKMMATKYSLANMKNEYHSKQNKEQVAAQKKEEEDLPCSIPERAEVSREREIGTYGVSSASTEPPKQETPTVAEVTKVEDNLPTKETPQPAEVAESKDVPEPVETPKPAEAKPAVEKPVAYTLKVKTPLMNMAKGGVAFQGYNESNDLINVVIRKDRIEQHDPDIERIMSEASTASSKVTFNGYPRADRVYVA